MQSEIYEYFSGKFGAIKGDTNANFDSSYTKNSSNLAQILICEDEKDANCKRCGGICGAEMFCVA